MIEASIQLNDQRETQTVHREWDPDQGKIAGADFSLSGRGQNTFEIALKSEMGRQEDDELLLPFCLYKGNTKAFSNSSG